jgi:hypothetical protein
MSLRQRGTDRRRSTRYEIVGSLRGIAVSDRHVRVHNVSATGALIETHSPLLPESRVSLRIVAGGVDQQVEAQIRHVRSVSASAFFIGVQFVNQDPALAEWLEELFSAAPRERPPED